MAHNPTPRALLFTLYFFMAGVGLIGTALPVYLQQSALSDSLGIIMAAYSLGLLVGGLGAGVLQRRLHCRSAMLGICSLWAVTALGHTLVQPEWSLFGLRMLTGLFAALMLILVETKLLAAAPSHVGRLLTLYQLTVVAGLGTGQLLLRLPLSASAPFLLVALLALLAMLTATQLSRRCCKAEGRQLAPTTIRQPTARRAGGPALVGAVCAGVLIGTFFGIVPAGLAQTGLTPGYIGECMAILIFSGLLLQSPARWLANRLGRLIPLVCSLGLLTLLLAGLLVGWLDYQSWVLVAVGSLLAVIYPMSLGVWSDAGGQAGGWLMGAYAAGGFTGPIAASASLALAGMSGIYALCLLTLIIGLMVILLLERQRRSQ